MIPGDLHSQDDAQLPNAFEVSALKEATDVRRLLRNITRTFKLRCLGVSSSCRGGIALPILVRKGGFESHFGSNRRETRPSQGTASCS